MTLLSQPMSNWQERHVPPCLAKIISFMVICCRTVGKSVSHHQEKMNWSKIRENSATVCSIAVLNIN